MIEAKGKYYLSCFCFFFLWSIFLFPCSGESMIPVSAGGVCIVMNISRLVVVYAGSTRNLLSNGNNY